MLKHVLRENDVELSRTDVKCCDVVSNKFAAFDSQLVTPSRQFLGELAPTRDIKQQIAHHGTYCRSDPIDAADFQ